MVGQAMMTMQDEHAPMFGSHPQFMAQDRYVGYDQARWLPANENTTQQGSLPGVQISYPAPSSNAQFTGHNRENTDVVWSAKSDGEFYEHQYSEPGLSPDATQRYGQNVYAQQTTTNAGGQLYKVDEYGHHVNHREQ